MTTRSTFGTKNEPGMRQIRPGVWELRVYAGRDANGNPVQLRKVVDSGDGKVDGGVRKARETLNAMRSEVADNGTKKKTAVAAGYTVAKLLETLPHVLRLSGSLPHDAARVPPHHRPGARSSVRLHEGV